MVTGVAILAGIVGHVLMPELTEETRSELYPLYMVEYLPQGVLGLGMAALIVGSMSTGAGIGTAISGLVTNDLVKVINSDRYTDRQTGGHVSSRRLRSYSGRSSRWLTILTAWFRSTSPSPVRLCCRSQSPTWPLHSVRGRVAGLLLHLLQADVS